MLDARTDRTVRCRSCLWTSDRLSTGATRGPRNCRWPRLGWIPGGRRPPPSGSGARQSRSMLVRTHAGCLRCPEGPLRGAQRREGPLQGIPDRLGHAKGSYGTSSDAPKGPFGALNALKVTFRAPSLSQQRPSRRELAMPPLLDVRPPGLQGTQRCCWRIRTVAGGACLERPVRDVQRPERAVRDTDRLPNGTARQRAAHFANSIARWPESAVHTTRPRATRPKGGLQGMPDAPKSRVLSGTVSRSAKDSAVDRAGAQFVGEQLDHVRLRVGFLGGRRGAVVRFEVVLVRRGFRG